MIWKRIGRGLWENEWCLETFFAKITFLNKMLRKSTKKYKTLYYQNYNLVKETFDSFLACPLNQYRVVAFLL